MQIMKIVKIPNTDIYTSRLGFGTSSLHHLYFKSQRRRLIFSALDSGFRYFDTARMSESPKNGVVDVNLKVHGSKNIFIVGSSVFPTNGWVNPSFTIAALGIRLADHIEKNLLRNLI